MNPNNQEQYTSIFQRNKNNKKGNRFYSESLVEGSPDYLTFLLTVFSHSSHYQKESKARKRTRGS